MSRGPMIYKAIFAVRLTPEQKEEVRKAATKVGSHLGIFARETLVKAAAKINKTA